MVNSASLSERTCRQRPPQRLDGGNGRACRRSRWCDQQHARGAQQQHAVIAFLAGIHEAGREADGEGGAATLFAGNGQRAAELPQDAGGNRQAKARAAAALGCGSRLLEFDKDPLLFLPGHARTGIGNRDNHVTAIHRDAGQNPARRGEFHRIADHVEKHLAQPCRVEVHQRRHVEGHRRADLDRFLVRARRQHFDHAFQQLAQVLRAAVQAEAAGLQRGIIQQVIDQLGHGQPRLMNAVDVVLLFERQAGLLQQMAHAENAGQRRAQFMHHGRHVPCLGMAFLFGMQARLLAPMARIALGRHVTGKAEYLCLA